MIFPTNILISRRFFLNSLHLLKRRIPQFLKFSVKNAVYPFKRMIYIEQMTVNDRQLDSIDSRISSWGFGGWALGGEYWGPQDHKDSVRAIHRALALGINHFDTAPVYGKGRSEQLIGQQIKRIRQDCILATKAFYTTPEEMLKSLETSLKRLLTDYIDIFYIHWPKSGIDMRPGMDALENLRRKGRIKAIGVSNFSIEQVKMVQQAGQVDFYQGGYSVLWPVLENSIIPYCRERNIRFIPYGILAQGILTNRGLEKLQTRLPGFRHKMLLYKPETVLRIEPLVKELRDTCRECSWTVENAVSLYTLKATGAISPLLGVRNREQAEKNFNIPSGELPEQILTMINRLKREILSIIPKSDNMFGHES